MIMKNHKSVDWSLPFRQVSSKQEFDQLDAQCYIYDNNNHPISFEKREQIRIPIREVVKRVSTSKKPTKIPPNYIRGSQNLNYPSAENYEPRQADHKFVEYNEQRFYIKGKKFLTTEFLKKCITELQLKAGKNMSLLNRGWITTFLQKEYKQSLSLEVLNQLCEIIYEHWINMRRDFKSPLLRLFWKPKSGQYNYMAAFYPREREKRNLRRNNRKVETKVLKQMCQEFYLASKIVDSIQMRENLKLKKIITQITSFYAECSPLASLPQYVSDLKAEEKILFQNNSRYLTSMRLIRLKLKHYLAFIEDIEDIQERKAQSQ